MSEASKQPYAEPKLDKREQIQEVAAGGVTPISFRNPRLSGPP